MHLYFSTKYYIFLILLLGLMLGSCSEKPISEDQALSFLKYYSGDQFQDNGQNILQTADGGYAFLGSIKTAERGSEIALILVDEYGNQKEAFKYFGWVDEDIKNYNDYGTSLVQADDGGFFIGGNTIINELSNIHLIRTDASGNTLWDTLYITQKERVLNDLIISDFNNEIVITGTTIGDDGDTDILIAHFNPDNGNFISSSAVGLFGNWGGNSIINGKTGYLAAGFGGDVNKTQVAQVFQIPLKGDIAAKSVLTGVGSASEAKSIYEINDDNYIIGCNKKINENSTNIVLVQIKENNLTPNWNKEYSLEEINDIKKVKIINNQIYALFNTTSSKSTKTVILKTDIEGNNPGYFPYGGEEKGFEGNGFANTVDQGLVITGKNIIVAPNNSKAYLLKLNSLLKLE